MLNNSGNYISSVAIVMMLYNLMNFFFPSIHLLRMPSQFQF